MKNTTHYIMIKSADSYIVVVDYRSLRYHGFCGITMPIRLLGHFIPRGVRGGQTLLFPHPSLFYIVVVVVYGS